MSKNTTVTYRVGFWGWIQIIFLLLKLNPGGHLDSPVENWSWWLVWSPTIIGFIFSIFVIVVMLIIVAFSDK